MRIKVFGLERLIWPKLTLLDARTAPVAVWQVLEGMSKEERRPGALRERDRPSAAERNLDIGYPFGWYAFMLSNELAVGEVKPLRYFGRDLADLARRGRRRCG